MSLVSHVRSQMSRQMWYVVCQLSNVKCHLSSDSWHMSHVAYKKKSEVTCHIWNVTCHMSFVRWQMSQVIRQRSIVKCQMSCAKGQRQYGKWPCAWRLRVGAFRTLSSPRGMVWTAAPARAVDTKTRRKTGILMLWGCSCKCFECHLIESLGGGVCPNMSSFNEKIRCKGTSKWSLRD